MYNSRLQQHCCIVVYVDSLCLTVSGAQDPMPMGRDFSIDLPGVGVPAIDSKAVEREAEYRAPPLLLPPRAEGNLGVATNAWM